MSVLNCFENWDFFVFSGEFCHRFWTRKLTVSTFWATFTADQNMYQLAWIELNQVIFTQSLSICQITGAM